MTFSFHQIKFYKKVVLLMALFFSFALVSHADPLSSSLKDWIPAGISGKLVIYDNEYIVQEVKIILVDQKERGKHYLTRILDMNGKELGQDELKNGKYVFVKGGGLQNYNGYVVVVAKEIVILPREMNRAALERAGLYKTPPEPW
ncbi:MAG: hypothetical protein JXM72_00320 [Deltaproteobacteria bacterium]|nr:hypothetical protein [Deltaproteobacteria bacterium]